MKILFFARRFYPLIGGVEKHCLEIGRRLVTQGHTLTVVTENPTEVRVRVRDEGIDGIEIYRIPITVGEKLKKFQIWWWLWKNRKLIREADIVHCHDVFYWYLPFRFLYPKKKVFTTFHGYEGNEQPKWNKILSHKIAGWFSNGSTAIGDWHEKWYGVKPEIVSYGAVGKGSPACRQAGSTRRPAVGGTRDDKCHFCFVGRLAKDTGIMIYLMALKILKDKGKSYSLIICGDGPQMQEAVEFSKKNKLDVRFVGFVEDVDIYIEKSKFVFVSRYLGILEAIAAKKLVFAVYDSEIKKDYLEMAPFSQWIVIEDKPEELAKKVMFFFDNPEEVKKLVEEGYNWVREQTWEKLTEKYLELWGITEVSSYSTPRVYNEK